MPTSMAGEVVASAVGHRIFASNDPYGITFSEVPLGSGTLSHNGGRYSWTANIDTNVKRFFRLIATSGAGRGDKRTL